MIKKVKIGWKEYKVIVNEEVYTDGTPCYGKIDFINSAIYLREGNSEDQMKATLIHEIIHGMDDMHSLDLDEQAVTKIADSLFTVIKDNPKLLDFITKGGKDVG